MEGGGRVGGGFRLTRDDQSRAEQKAREKKVGIQDPLCGSSSSFSTGWSGNTLVVLRPTKQEETRRENFPTERSSAIAVRGSTTTVDADSREEKEKDRRNTQRVEGRRELTLSERARKEGGI